MNAFLERAVAPLFPGYFNLVMATGIVSNGFFLLGHHAFSDVLLVAGFTAYPLLLAAVVLRAIVYPRLLWADLVDPRLVFTFFTLVAATDVLGSGLHLRGDERLATALWLFALAVWVVLGYFSFAVLTFVNNESGAEVVHGGWLIAIVGTESLVILGDLLTPRFGALENLAQITVYALWGIGIVFYGIFITLFTHRIFFLRLEPAEMGPLFWVVMGAAAISTNAGSTLIANPPALPFLRAMRPFVDGTTLILWAWGTWWIPLLVILGFWRHVVRRFPLRYEPGYWNLVFPLGMYTVATFRLSLAADYTALQSLARVMIWIAFAAWLATAAGLLSVVRPTRRPRS
ncbi:MAG TPA: tellurite resistance/C4-dicarboxylate transporter family protein [Gaiellaceae bacterium]|nr:tellurite resistance/C4-dicarboxylate transporter family protein [Gaiellaceae bacterium]